MKFDLSWTIASIIAVAAFLSPIVTCFLNNKHQLKIKKLDMYEKAKRDALNEFIECTEDYLLNLNFTEQNVKYYSSLNKLFIYFSNINIDTFKDFDTYCKNNDYSKATFELVKIVQLLSQQIAKE